MNATAITPTPLTTDEFAKGSRVALSVLSGYRLAQDRPYACSTFGPIPSKPGKYSHGCKCDATTERPCNGRTTVYQGTVEDLIFWMDNSVEATVRCDDGQVRTARLKAPSGDVCF